MSKLMFGASHNLATNETEAGHASQKQILLNGVTLPQLVAAISADHEEQLQIHYAAIDDLLTVKLKIYAAAVEKTTAMSSRSKTPGNSAVGPLQPPNLIPSPDPPAAPEASNALSSRCVASNMCLPLQLHDHHSQWVRINEDSKTKYSHECNHRSASAASSVDMATATKTTVEAATAKLDQTWKLLMQLQSEDQSVPLLRVLGLDWLDLEDIRKQLVKQRLPLAGLKKFATSNIFNAVVLILILTNAIFIATVSNFAMKDAIRASGHESALGLNDASLDPSLTKKVDQAFTAAFTIELCVRLFAFEGAFAFGPDWHWNMLDFSLVFMSLLETVLAASGHDMSYVRLLRILRMTRTTRVLRLVRFFKTLRILLLSALNAAVPFVWAILFLLLMIFVFAVVLLQGVTGYFTASETANSETHDELLKFFDSLPTTLLSLFMAVTGGVSWIELTMPLSEISTGYVFLVTMYVAVMVLVTLNIVTSIFVNEAVEMTQRHRELSSQAEMEKTQYILKELTKLFFELDEQKSGEITQADFEHRLEDRQTRHFFAAIGLDVTCASEIFSLMDVDGNGCLQIEEFVIGCMELKGGAKAVSMEALMRQHRRLMKKLTRDANNIKVELVRLEEIMLRHNGL